MDEQILERLKRSVAQLVAVPCVGATSIKGTAFLITPTLAVTCAHCLGRDGEGTWARRVRLHFSRVGSSGADIEAEVAGAPDWERDVAILQLARTVDEASTLIELALTAPPEAKWYAFGHPSPSGDSGIVMAGKVRDPQGVLPSNGFSATVMQLTCEEAQDRIAGASGAPVLVERFIVGMLNNQLLREETLNDYSPETSSRYLPAHKTVYALPVESMQESLKAACPGLSIRPRVRDGSRKRQIDPAAFDSYQSRFIRADELPKIHSINDETFLSTDLVPESTLEQWWKANPYNIRLVSHIDGEVVGYWQILTLTASAYSGLCERQLTERQIGPTHILRFEELEIGSVYIYVTALSVRESMRQRSAPVILDLMAFLQLLNKIIPITAISALPVSDDPLNLIMRFGMVKSDSQSSEALWILDTRKRIECAFDTARKHLSNLKGLVPAIPPSDRQTIKQLLRR